MAKAAMEIGIGAAVIGASFLVPGSGITLLGANLAKGAAQGALLGLGSSLAMSGIGQALSSTPSAGVTGTIKSPTSPTVIVYGRAMVGGTLLYITENNNAGGSTTSSNKQLHRMYALAAHPCAISKGYEIWYNSKQVPTTNTTDSVTGIYDWVSYNEDQKTSSISSLSVDSDGVGTMVLSSNIGDLDGTQIQIKNCSPDKLNGKFILTIGSDDLHYTYTAGVTSTTCTSLGSVKTLYPQYSNKLKGQIMDGTNTATSPEILASGTDWPSTAVGYGYTTAYVQAGYDSSVFSSIPDIQFLIYGKNDILDFRTSATGWTDNAALIIADYLMLSRSSGGIGLSESDLDTASFITAANTCDETITLIDGTTEKRYTCNGTVYVNKGRGSILQDLLASCSGRIIINGGKFGLQVGVAQSPVMTITPDMIINGITYKPRQTITSTANAVKGTYTSSENLYQPSDYPPYLQDTEHEYSSDQYLIADGGERIYDELNLIFTSSSAMAQRLAKIHLLRKRNNKTLSITCDMRTYQLVAGDWCYIDFPRYSLDAAQYEVTSSTLTISNNRLAMQLELRQVDDDIFSFNENEQLTPQGYTYPNASPIINDPTGLTVYSGTGDTASGLPSTISTQADGTTINSLYVQWTTPTDPAISKTQIQYMLSTATAWTALTDVDISANSVFISHVSVNQSYYVRIRFVTYATVYSDWVESGSTAVSSAYSADSTSTTELDDSAIGASALSSGTAIITLSDTITFTISSSSFSFSVTDDAFTGLNQSQLYYVYFVNSTFAQSGTITPIVTQTQSDFYGKSGYFLIGSITTPSYATTYRPTTYTNYGTNTPQNVTNAYDTDTTTACIIRGEYEIVYSDS